jgi:hypothetical protein
VKSVVEVGKISADAVSSNHCRNLEGLTGSGALVVGGAATCSCRRPSSVAVVVVRG